MSVVQKSSRVTILFAGDSGDGIQLTGGQFTNTAALYGNDISTFPNFPAEIRAPQGTLAGVSGFQLHFGSEEIFTPGDSCDVLVAMNAAALRANLGQVKTGGTIIINSDGFDAKNLRLAGYTEGQDPLRDPILERYNIVQVDVTKLTRECLKESGLSTKDMDRSKNMFVLGFIYWMYNRKLDHTLKFIREKFAAKPELAEANIKTLEAGYHFAETSEVMQSRFEVGKAQLEKGTYRNITGNQATSLGLIAASSKAGLQLFYGTYPITPASDILHELSKHKNFGVKTFQAEDEIAAICASIGASFGGALGVTASSGPGIALKGEAIGLAMMLELPLVIINVQRGGPSTGLPTKTEQADLFQALYGRNGECPVPVVASSTPADCFEMVREAARIAVEHMTPVIFLSDGYLANGSEPWKFPSADSLSEIKPPFVSAEKEEGQYMPYLRDEKLVRTWAVPGMAGYEHRVGGLEKQDITGNISYDPENHDKMVRLRAEKVARIANYIPEQKIDNGPDSGKLLVIGWGSTYGAIKTAVRELLAEGLTVSHAQVRYINPFPSNFGDLLQNFETVLVPEMNLGQLATVIRSEFGKQAESFSKVKGIPFTVEELKERMRIML